jgi:hypothetical protein
MTDQNSYNTDEFIWTQTNIEKTKKLLYPELNKLIYVLNELNNSKSEYHNEISSRIFVIIGRLYSYCEILNNIQLEKLLATLQSQISILLNGINDPGSLIDIMDSKNNIIEFINKT